MWKVVVVFSMSTALLLSTRWLKVTDPTAGPGVVRVPAGLV
jgi:hypothetical protein